MKTEQHRYTGRAHRYPPNTPFYIFQLNIRTESFKNAAHSPFFSLFKIHLFQNAIFFWFCIIRILHTGCAKI
jgi:hypothetical protein